MQHNNLEMVVHWFDVIKAFDIDLAIEAAWTQSEAGRWVMSNAVGEVRIERTKDTDAGIARIAIIARLSKENQTYFNLKYR